MDSDEVVFGVTTNHAGREANHGEIDRMEAERRLNGAGSWRFLTRTKDEPMVLSHVKFLLFWWTYLPWQSFPIVRLVTLSLPN